VRTHFAITSGALSRFVVSLGSIVLSGSILANELTSAGANIMAGKLDGKKVAILLADGFEQVEMTKPREALNEAGAETKIVS